jgi:hypothetical protein
MPISYPIGCPTPYAYALDGETGANISFPPEVLTASDSLFFLGQGVVFFVGTTLNGFIFYVLKNAADAKHGLIIMNLAVSGGCHD